MSYLHPPRDFRGPRPTWSVSSLGVSSRAEWPPLRFGCVRFSELVRIYEAGREKREWTRLGSLLLSRPSWLRARVVGHVPAEHADRLLSRKGVLYVVEFCERLLFCLPDGEVVAELSSKKP